MTDLKETKVTMINKKLSAVGVAAAIALSAVACNNDRLTNINVNPNQPTTAPAPTLFTSAARLGVSRWLGNFDIRGFELVAQHVAEVQYPESDQYKRLAGSFTEGNFNAAYSSELKDFQEVIRQGTASNSPGIYGPALVMRTWEFGLLTDVWGDIPYFEALKGDSTEVANRLTPAYDPQQNIINDFFVQLGKAVTDMRNAPAGSGSLGGADPIYGGNLTNWVRFANSLRARYAMRISYKDQAKANTELTAAFSAANGGVMQSNDDMALLPWPGDGVYDNPWSVNFQGRDDHRISDRLLTIMRERNDPRITVFAQLPDRDTLDTPLIEKWCLSGSPPCYVGLANAYTHDEVAPYVPYASRPGEIFYPASTAYGEFAGTGSSYPSYIMTYAEVAFIQAEAAERSLGGLTPGQAQGFYEDGITASMEQWGITDPATIAAYLANPNVSYTAAGTQVERLKRIAIQKWLALFSDGAMAWAEFRRTCQPARLKPGPAAITDIIPQRFEYSPTEYAVNGTSVNAAVTRQGADDFDTPVWWNTNRTSALTYEAGCGVR